MLAALPLALALLGTAAEPDTVELPSGLRYQVLASGETGGPTPGPRTPCAVHYTGTLISGAKVGPAGGSPLSSSLARNRRHTRSHIVPPLNLRPLP
jgi:hypothetical protein